MDRLTKSIAGAGLVALAVAAAALAATAGVVTLHPGQSKKVGKHVVLCTTRAVQKTGTRIVLHPGHQVRVGKTTVKCVATPKPTPTPTPSPTPAPAPPPPPPPPTVSALTPGSYKGATQDGNSVFFTITADRRITGWRVNDLTEQCNDNYYIPGAVSMGDSFIPIADDGHFDFVADGTGTIAGSPDAYHFEIAGTVSATSVSGTVVLGDVFDYAGHHLSCASPVTNWTATLQP
jgi:hypothetical protein